MAVPLGLPEGGGDCCGIGGAGSVGDIFRGGGCGRGALEQFVEPLGVDVAAEKIGFSENAAEEAGVGLDAGDGVLLKSAAETSDGFFTAIAPGDELAEERIVVH